MLLGTNNFRNTKVLTGVVNHNIHVHYYKRECTYIIKINSLTVLYQAMFSLQSFHLVVTFEKLSLNNKKIFLFIFLCLGTWDYLML